jgi:hypothetical protein
MANKIHQISAGRHPVYEVIEHDDGYMTIRHVEDHSKAVTLPTSTRTALMNILRDLVES